MNVQPTLKQLKYLCAVAKSRHFGQAATDCHISQSTLSTAIHELEDHLGAVLIERNNKRVYLTTLGEEVVSRSKDILVNVSDIVSLCHRSEKPFSHELRLGVIPTIAPYLLPSLLQRMRSEYPYFKLSLKEELSKPLVENLSNGKLDVLLLALPFPTQGTSSIHLFNDDFLFACPQNHPLSQHGSVRVKDLDNQKLLLLEDGHCLRDHALEACKLDSNNLSVPFQASSLNTLVQMVANGMGVTLLPRMAIEGHLVNDIPVTIKPFQEKNITRSVGLIWRNTSPRKEEIELLGRLLRQLWGNN